MGDYKDQLRKYAKENNMRIEEPNKPPRNQSSNYGKKPIPEYMVPDNDYVSIAENVILNLKDDINKYKPFGELTTSKIRKILSLVSDISNDAITADKVLPPQLVNKIRHLKVRIAYEAGRERDVKKFVDKAKLLDGIDYIGSSKESFIRFSQYLEALVAYHRFYGGRPE